MIKWRSSLPICLILLFVCLFLFAIRVNTDIIHYYLSLGKSWHNIIEHSKITDWSLHLPCWRPAGYHWWPCFHIFIVPLQMLPLGMAKVEAILDQPSQRWEENSISQRKWSSNQKFITTGTVINQIFLPKVQFRSQSFFRQLNSCLN